MKELKKITTAVCFCLLAINGYAQLKVAQIFSDDMVLQRNEPITIWGWNTPGARMEVHFNNTSEKVSTDKDGSWEVAFEALPASGPYSISVKSGNEKVNYNNILIGDVWLCSGQSNMEWTVANTSAANSEMNGKINSKIRHFKVPRSYASKAEKNLQGGQWEVANEKTIGNFTAVGYYFAKEIAKNEDIPIGLLNSSWGGSRIEPWMNAKSLDLENPEKVFENLEKEMKEKYATDLANLKSDFRDLEETETLKIDSSTAFIKTIAADSFQKIESPALWENLGFGALDGVAWYRNNFNLTKKEKEAGIVLNLGKIDDSDITFVNGRPIGTTLNAYADLRNYRIPSAALKVGNNAVLLKVYDTGGAGGMYGTAKDFSIQTSTGSRDFYKNWEITFERIKKAEFNQPMNQVPTALYNKMIYPILDFPIKGVLWYQGESNTSSENEAYEYRNLFKTMISQWRSDFNAEDLPFLYVQLANFMQPAQEPQESNWAALRESQSEALQLENTAQAVIIDIGEAGDIHPKNKTDVGKRLALAALHKVYGNDTLYSGPVFKNYSLDGNKVVLEFDHLGSGLMLKGGNAPAEFAIAGADKKFKWAKAELKDDKILVWHEGIAKPKYLRFAWGDNPDHFNLYNTEGLPASPFRFEIKK